MSISENLQRMFDLSGRVAVVTGGSGLLGEQFCRTLAQAGASVIIADIDLSRAKAIEKDLTTDGYAVRSIPTDVTQRESVYQMVNQTLDLYGQLDILVNSAALDPKFDPIHEGIDKGYGKGAFEDFPLGTWEEALKVNLTGAFLCCQAASKPMVQQGRGVIINLCSIYGLVGPDQRIYNSPGTRKQFKPVYYSVTKAGILGLTSYLATYFAGKNIRVNALSPGGVYNQHDQAFVKAYSARAVLGRMAEKEELNGALLFLASDASAYMTGANLIVDGGWTAW